MDEEEAPLAIDLLYQQPQHRVALPVIERALVFAFAAGDTAGAFERILEKAVCPSSCFHAEYFAADLFLPQFVERCLPLQVAGRKFTTCKGYLLQVLCAPPPAADVLFRQGIQRELQSSAASRKATEQLYVWLCDLRTLLSSGEFSSRADSNVRRLDILRTLLKIFRHMAQDFTRGASGLERIFEHGQRVLASNAFTRVNELLEYEQHSATVDLRVQVGSDGSVRSFQLLGHRENTHNAFYSSRLGRTWARIKMFVLGYRMSQQEVLSRLLDHVFDAIRPALLPLFQLLGDLEFHLGGLGLVDAAKQAGLNTSFPSFEHDAGVDLQELFNPFLVAEGVHVQPCSLAAPPASIVIVTGPNSGGKTRLLQSVALSQLLAQSGLCVPAARARLSLRNGLFVSLLNEVRADQQEGRLGMELMRIRRLFEQFQVGDMVLIDELCSGTNPSEGEEIFRLVLELLAQLQPQVWVTTHLLQFAEQLQHAATHHGTSPSHAENAELPLLQFLQVKLDAAEHPTFEFEPGVAKTSLARQTAARLGVTREELVALVERAQRRSGSREFA